MSISSGELSSGRAVLFSPEKGEKGDDTVFSSLATFFLAVIYGTLNLILPSWWKDRDLMPLDVRAGFSFFFSRCCKSLRGWFGV